MGGESPSGGGGSRGPVGVTYSGNKISKKTRKGRQAQGCLLYTSPSPRD